MWVRVGCKKVCVVGGVPMMGLKLVTMDHSYFPVRLSRGEHTTVGRACGNRLCRYPMAIRGRGSVRGTLRSMGGTRYGTLIIFLKGFKPRAPRALVTREFSKPYVCMTTTRNSNSVVGNENSTCYNVLGYSCGLGVHRLGTCVPRCPIKATSSVTGVVTSFMPITHTIVNIDGLGVVAFKPHPRSFFTYGTPVGNLCRLNIRVRRGSRLSLLISFGRRRGSPHVPRIYTSVTGRVNRNGCCTSLGIGVTRFRLALLS